jgi:signal transduction histidine kinase
MATTSARTMSSARSQAEGARTGDPVGEPLIAVVMARVMVVAVYFGFCLLALLGVISGGYGPWPVALAAVALLAMLGLQVLYFGRLSTPQRSTTTYVLLAAQACLAFLPMWVFGVSWDGMPAMFAGTALLILPPVLAWPAFAGSVVVVALVAASAPGPVMGWYAALGVVAFGLEVWGLTRLAWVITELHEARSELAKAAVAHERLRFARDLHEMLGLALSAISQKGELARRLIGRSPERARDELSEILGMARRALSDVRAVARGYRELNLDEASRSAGSVLAASSVEVRMELNHGELPVPVRTQLAMVLREGVTNVLRHSRAERCEIELHQAGDTVTLDIVNDGIDRDLDPETSVQSGGIAKLASAVADAGGSLSAGVDPDGRFRLHVTVPVAQRNPPHDDEDAYDKVPRAEMVLVRAVLISVLCGHFLQASLRLATLVPDARDISLGVAYLSVMLAIQLFHFGRPGVRLHSPRSYVLLAVLAVLTCLPLLQVGVPWLGLYGFLIASVLLVLPSVAGWAAVAVLLVLATALQSYAGATATGIFYNLMGAMMIGLAVYGLTWMVRLVAELRATRTQLAEAAVAEERLRFARDLHDLLGLSLSAITLKSELAHRLVLVDPDRANEQLTEILSIARLALADVPSVAAGYRELSLDEECQSAESLLSAIDVDVRLVQDCGELPRPVGTVLATILREAVTNVLRHSKGEWCEIALHRHNGSVVLDVVNDGVADEEEAPANGNGIHNLSARVASIGGELSAGIEDRGTFHLKAVVPI